jgi:type VI secretion system secreted protein Hcp
VSTGKVIKKAVLYGRKAGDDKRQDYLTVTLEEVMVSSWQTSASDGSGIPMLSASFSFSKIEYKYCVQKPDQTLDSPLMTTYDLKAAKK